ncbi:hypothetical protein Tco_0007562 [Tanacetum coccineum]
MGHTHKDISLFEDLSDIGSPGVVGPEHEGLPWMLDDPYVQVALRAPPSPDYIPGPEEPQSPPLPGFVLEPVYPEYMPQEDEVFLAEEQPLPAAASPTAQSPDYVLVSDPEAGPKEDDDEDPEEDPVDYLANEGDDGDDEDESSEDDDEVDIEADDDEEEEHPALSDSAVVALPAVDQAPSTEETEPFETDESAATPPPHPAYRVTARISIPAPVPTIVWSDAEVTRLFAISTPPSSPLSPWSSPLPQIPSPPLPLIPSPSLPVSSPVPMLSPSPPASPIRTPPLHLLSNDRREDKPEVTLPPRKRLGIALGPRYEIRESSSTAAARPAGGLRADYGFVATIDKEIWRDPERDVGYGITDSDRRAHTRTARLMETEARMSREAWGRSMDVSNLAGAKVMSLRTTVLAQQLQIRELQSANSRRQTVITEMLAADHKRQKQLTEALKLIKRLQTQMTEFERQQGPAKGPAQLELPEEAGSSS